MSNSKLRQLIEEAELNLLLTLSWQPEDRYYWNSKVEALRQQEATV